MDAAIRIFRNNKYLLSFIALALALTASASAQPAFTLNTNTVTFNQSIIGAAVQVTSTSDPITFSVAKTYLVGGNNAWLNVSSGGTTPSTIEFSVGNTAGLSAGTAYTATVTLNATSPATGVSLAT